MTIRMGGCRCGAATVAMATAPRSCSIRRRSLREFGEILAKSEIPDDKLSIASYYFFERLKLFAIFTKHHGFLEENEWRVVYMRDRDTAHVFDRMFSYWVGPRGVEPKLKLKIEAIPGLPETNLPLAEIVDRIILGPSLSSPLTHNTILKISKAWVERILKIGLCLRQSRSGQSETGAGVTARERRIRGNWRSRGH